MSKIRVGIVEDIEEIRQAVASLLLWDERFELVFTLSRGEDALETIPGLKPDIVIMDINLPGMNGIECIRQLKPDLPDTQFMIFTIYENDENIFTALEAGASSYMLKKTGLPHIAESLIELYDGGSPMSALIARKLVTRYHKVPEKNSSLDKLSPREQEVLTLLSEGLLYKEIAGRLLITTGTVKQQIHRIYEKLHVGNKTEAINKAFRR
ncbi:MAG: response regulator transcription factor [Chitinophagaceae bacterium]|nr:response regulator transcription factor [Chitinophagaceae bacterium]